MATKKKSAAKENVPAGGWPKIIQGSHLTVIEHEDGRRELQWDDEALMRDVRAAILKAESVIPVAVEEPKRFRKKKNVKE
jgi:hypothetical protein